VTQAFAIRAAVLIAWPGIYHLERFAHWRLPRRTPEPPQPENPTAVAQQKIYGWKSLGSNVNGVTAVIVIRALPE
jgi:hypothetical protein